MFAIPTHHTTLLAVVGHFTFPHRVQRNILRQLPVCVHSDTLTVPYAYSDDIGAAVCAGIPRRRQRSPLHAAPSLDGGCVKQLAHLHSEAKFTFSTFRPECSPINPGPCPGTGRQPDM